MIGAVHILSLIYLFWHFRDIKWTIHDISEDSQQNIRYDISNEKQNNENTKGVKK